MLPVVVTSRNKARLGLATCALLMGIYMLTNALTLRSVIVLHPWRLDDVLGLHPWTVWIYCSYPALFVTAYALEDDIEQVNKFFYADVAANVASELTFLAFPTTFARPIELPPTTAASRWLLETYWRVDAPTNCFPSLHVSTAILPALMLWKNRPRISVAYGAWAAAISLSTMTTKQHHSLDVLGGVVVAMVTYAVFFHGVRYATSNRGTLA